MTTISTPRASNRAIAVTRLHVVNTWSVFALPAIIMGVILIANIAIWALIFANTPAADQGNVREGLQYSGSASYIFVYMAIVAIQSTAVTFPYALGFGVTRRAYAGGSALAYLGLAVVYTIALTVLGFIEELTHGWGFGGRMFTAIYFGGDSWYVRSFVYFAFLLFFFFAGAMFGAVYVRWRATGIVGAFAVIILALIGLAAILGLLVGWEPVFGALDDLSDIGTVSLLFIPTAIAAAVSFLVLRRATIRN